MRAVSQNRILLLFLPVLLLTACAVLRPGTKAVSENPAVLMLVEQAHAEAAENKLRSAVATIERAQRLEPRNPWLWQELARLHLAQGDFAQAESFAARSNTWAGNDGTLHAANWRLIAEARAARGDTAGAQEAETRATQLERR
jgi:predicted Zn-dependent protease